MQKNKYFEGTELRFLLRAVAVWAVSALLLLVAAALIISKSNINEAAMGYISSGLSFLSAFAAGVAAANKRGKGLSSALVTAAVLIITLLTLGFLIKGPGMEASGVLSVVSFTLAGCVSGAALAPGKTKRIKKSRFSHSQRR